MNSSERPDFQTQRDQRTDLLLKTGMHKTAKVLVVIGSATAETFAGQMMSVTLFNLLPRVFNHLAFISPAVSLIRSLSLFDQPTLVDEIRYLIKACNPEIILHDSTEHADLVIGIGLDSREIIKRSPDVIIDADGWVCAVNPEVGLNHTSTMPMGPVLAACFGLSELLKRCEGYDQTLHLQNRVSSLLDFEFLTDLGTVNQHNSQYPSSLDLGKILMVGAGAVGSAVAYLLSMLDASFEIDIVDYDHVDTSNISKSLYWYQHAVEKSHKAHVLAAFLNRGSKVARGHVGTYSDFSRVHLRTPNLYDVVLPLADVREEDGSISNTRVQMQAGYFPLMIHGTTTRDWGVNLHRHIPFVDDCIVCRFPPRRYTVKFSCGEEKSSEGSGGTVDHLALPFQPLMAATLVVSELIKLSMPGYPSSTNKIYIDSKGPLNLIVQSRCEPKSDCDCRKKSLGIHKKWNGQSKYDSFVPGGQASDGPDDQG